MSTDLSKLADTGLPMRERINAMRRVLDRKNDELDSVKRLLVSMIKSKDDTNGKFIALRFGLHLLDPSVEPFVRELATYPNNEPLEIRRAALSACIFLKPPDGAQLLRRSIGDSDLEFQAAWNTMVARLAADLPSEEARDFCQSVLQKHELSAIHHEARLVLCRLGDRDALRWVRQRVKECDDNDPFIINCLFVLATQGDATACDRLRALLRNFDNCDQSTRTDLRIAMLSIFRIPEEDIDLALREALKRIDAYCDRDE